MSELFTKIVAFVKANLIIILIVVGVILIFFPKMFRGLLPRRRIRRRRIITQSTRARRRLPRSVGMRKSSPGGKAKKPWQIKGSEAARRHMAKLRRMR